MKNETVGIYYERPDGTIVLTVGFNPLPEPQVYYHGDGELSEKAPDAEFQTWKPRRDLSDFPNAIDPRLPYSFDLHWDIKYLSQLKAYMDRYEERLAARKQAVLECELEYLQMKELIIAHDLDLNYEQEKEDD